MTGEGEKDTAIVELGPEVTEIHKRLLIHGWRGGGHFLMIEKRERLGEVRFAQGAI